MSPDIDVFILALALGNITCLLLGTCLKLRGKCCLCQYITTWVQNVLQPCLCSDNCGRFFWKRQSNFFQAIDESQPKSYTWFHTVTTFASNSRTTHIVCSLAVNRVVGLCGWGSQAKPTKSCQVRLD